MLSEEYLEFPESGSYMRRRRWGESAEIPSGERVLMLYRNYKEHYADCRTVPGSYDAAHKTIEVIVPEGRMNPSGTRGERYSDYKFWFTVDGGGPRYAYYRAVNAGNAEKRFLRDCRREGWTPCEPPERR